MKIVILRTWLTNIGNGFIDKGAKAIVRQSFPEADIFEVSGFPNKTEEKVALGPLAGGTWRKLGDTGQKFRDHRFRTHPVRQNMVNLSEFVDADLAILPGCVLYDVGLEPYFQTLLELQARDIPIVILGAGGGDYHRETRQYVTEKLQQLDVCGLIARDTPTYEHYGDVVDVAHNGIDCAFFINEWHTPPESNQQFTVAAFDKVEEPPLQTDNRTIRPDHNPFGRSKPYQGLPRNVRDRLKNRNNFKRGNVFVSDLVTDYLFLYANTETTHSDRIHACVPTLAYGNQAKFHFDTPRGALFDNVGLSDITDRTVSLDEGIEEKKEQQVQQLRDTVDVLQNMA
ncbi:polysaccharide pyruvyl transferase family protein [Natrinema hispanicum]|uniref:Polysaccharide pyruvyl transferase n=1 Tax=Natrinema hispanicum TaxID=392421 RepID=A0A1I0JVV4_9EURY|nr:polysaccharide pyruvyl transferase family protein [Natrinema hispanicum]SEU14047.1 Polysaccharide pyruvyl transferase [Natrinema hispanicum]